MVGSHMAQHRGEGVQPPIAKCLAGYPFLVIAKSEIKIKSDIKIKNGKGASIIILQLFRVTVVEVFEFLLSAVP